MACEEFISRGRVLEKGLSWHSPCIAILGTPWPSVLDNTDGIGPLGPRTPGFSVQEGQERQARGEAANSDSLPALGLVLGTHENAGVA